MKSLEERVAELEEEVAYLKRELGLSLHLSHLRALTAQGLTLGEARVILALYHAKGRPLNADQIADATNRMPASIKVLVCRARRAEFGVETRYGLGYSLNTESRAHVAEILEQAA